MLNNQVKILDRGSVSLGPGNLLGWLDLSMNMAGLLALLPNCVKTSIPNEIVSGLGSLMRAHSFDLVGATYTKPGSKLLLGTRCASAMILGFQPLEL